MVVANIHDQMMTMTMMMMMMLSINPGWSVLKLAYIWHIVIIIIQRMYDLKSLELMVISQ